eukprot:TRINITY_DN11906_c0_g1_i1.p1 TRINITY_DN11906_c0_g1~~TRINITY_DN11906_c0_g1_i1.p1  ORF type:complete len:132 (+),score=13.97 TRINITY_DN11906_c0_g1_i1:28-396(+)
MAAFHKYALVFVVCFLGAASALKCWDSKLSTQRSPLVFEEKECPTSESKSCMIQRYSIAGQHHTRAMCSNMDKDTCTENKKGEFMETVCYCKKDYCNSAVRNGSIGVLLSILLGFWTLKFAL